MKKQGRIAAALLSLGLLASCSVQTQPARSAQQAADSSKKAETSSANQAGQGGDFDKKAALDFSLQGVDGKAYKLSDFKGKKVYLKFWASWCSICLSTLADTDDLAKEEEGKDYVVLSVVSPTFNGEKSAEDFKSWYRSLDYQHLPVLLDGEGTLIKEYGIRSYPSAVFVGSDGSVAQTHIGFMSKEEVLSTLKKIG